MPDLPPLPAADPAPPGESAVFPDPPATEPRAPARRIPGPLVVLAAGFLPGTLLGTHLAGLIFFLNPDLPFSPLPLMRGALVYGPLVGAVTLVVSLPWLWRRPRRARRWLPWGLTGALAAAALLDWAHASGLAFFLPPGMNLRLIKAAALLTLAALIAFYTALLHSLARRRYGRRSRWAYVALAVTSIYVMAERRDAFHPRPPPSPRPSAVEDSQRPTLLVVGIEGATLDAVLPLATQGRLPFLASMIEGGAYGRLLSLPQGQGRNAGLALWTTLATGKYPYKNGVLGEWRYPAPWLGRGAALEVEPSWLGFGHWGRFGAAPVRVDGDARDTLALWEVLPRLGVGAAVIGWPGSYPPANGPVFSISDRYFRHPEDAEAARPPELASRARLFALRPDELDPLLLDSFRGTSGDRMPRAVPLALTGDLWRESLATLLLPQYRQAEALFIELEGLSPVSLAYLGGYAEVQFEGSQDADDQRAARWVTAYYAQLDQFLNRLWDRTPPPKLLAVVSPYGAAPPQGARRLWQELTPGRALGASYEGSPDGVLLLYGEGVRPGVLLTGAQLVDLAPTLVYGVGLPIGRDLDGKVLTAAFERSFLAGHPLTFLPSYESLEEVDRQQQ